MHIVTILISLMMVVGICVHVRAKNQEILLLEHFDGDIMISARINPYLRLGSILGSGVRYGIKGENDSCISGTYAGVIEFIILSYSGGGGSSIRILFPTLRCILAGKLFHKERKITVQSDQPTYMLLEALN